ncbi:MAG TPA: hypothetical protein VF918_18790, partial [Anaerolineales bacterium]
IKSSNSSQSVSLNPSFPMTIDAEPYQHGNKERMLSTISASTKLLLNPALDLKCLCANDGTAIGNSRPVRIDQIRLFSTLLLSGLILLWSM